MLGSAFACLSCADAFLWYVWPIFFFNSKEGFSTNDKEQNKMGEKKTRKKIPQTTKNKTDKQIKKKTTNTHTHKKQPQFFLNTDQFMIIYEGIISYN